MPHTPGTGAIFGIVSENGVAKANSPIYLLDMRRDTGVGQAKVIAKQMSREDGGFTFASLNTGYTDYAVMASDEDGAEPKNALIQDRIQPVPAHAGTGAFGDWYTRAMKAGAEAVIITNPLQESPLIPYGLRTMVFLAGSDVDVTAVMGLPEVSAMSAIDIPTTGRLFTTGGNFTEKPGSSALEFILDLDSAGPTTTPLAIEYAAVSIGVGTTHCALTLSTGGRGSSGGTTVFRVTYNFSTKALTFGIANNANNRAWTTVATFDLTAYTGKKHLILSYTKGSEVSLYVDGAAAGSVVTAAEPLSVNAGAAYCAALLVGGTNSGDFGVDCLVGPLVSYGLPLSATQAAEHYKALYGNDNLPLLTGYAQELSKELPFWYYRFGEAEFTNGVFSELHAIDPVTSLPKAGGRLTFSDASLVVGAMDSPLVGRTSFEKPSTVTLSGASGMMGFPFNDRFTFTDWVNFNQAAAADEQLYSGNSISTYNTSQGNNNPRPSGMLLVKRRSDGKLSASFYNGSTYTEHVFNYVLPVGQWLNIWICVDKRAGVNRATLYVGTTATAPTAMATSVVPTGALFTMRDYHAGSSVPFNGNPSSVIGGSLKGRQVEMALLPGVVSEARIQAIWAAKDTP